MTTGSDEMDEHHYKCRKLREEMDALRTEVKRLEAERAELWGHVKQLEKARDDIARAELATDQFAGRVQADNEKFRARVASLEKVREAAKRVEEVDGSCDHEDCAWSELREALAACEQDVSSEPESDE